MCTIYYTPYVYFNPVCIYQPPLVFCFVITKQRARGGWRGAHTSNLLLEKGDV